MTCDHQSPRLPQKTSHPTETVVTSGRFRWKREAPGQVALFSSFLPAPFLLLRYNVCSPTASWKKLVVISRFWLVHLLRSFIQAPFISYVTKLGHGRLGDKVKQQLITLLFHARRDLSPMLPIRRLWARLLILGQWRGGMGRRPDVDGMSERRVADAPEQRLSSNASI